MGAGLAALAPMAFAVQGRPQQNPQLAGIWIVVFDPNGATIHNAQITLIDEKSQNKTTAVSDSDGRASFPGLAAGTYALTVSARGFQENRQVMQLGGQAISVKITMHLTALQGAVVDGTPTVIPTEDVRVDPITPYPIHPVKENKKR
jgi:Carboxypeptidase regulatory-like domain